MAPVDVLSVGGPFLCPESEEAAIDGAHRVSSKRRAIARQRSATTHVCLFSNLSKIANSIKICGISRSIFIRFGKSYKYGCRISIRMQSNGQQHSRAAVFPKPSENQKGMDPRRSIPFIALIGAPCYFSSGLYVPTNWRSSRNVTVVPSPRTLSTSMRESGPKYPRIRS